MFYDVPKIQADNKIKAGSRCCGNMKSICFVPPPKQIVKSRILLYPSRMKTKCPFLINLLVSALMLFPMGMVYSQSAAERGPAQAASSSDVSVLPLRKLALFSSGLGFFEHSGTVSSTAASPARINLSFTMNAVNDALKSLVVNDPRSDFPTLSYASSSALFETLRSLRVDLSGNPGIGEMLGGMRGAEIEVAAPGLAAGRILGVEYRRSPDGTGIEQWLSLYTDGGIRSMALKDIVSFSFKDPAINADLARALDLILESGSSGSRDLLLTLPGEGSRNVSLSYVIPVPVWKVSYRLDLGGVSASGTSSALNSFFQGWAIVDNDSDTDWNDIELSLVTGRPVSFIQNLYAPYHTSRPVVPLGIAGIAESRTYESGIAEDKLMAPEAEMALRYSGTGMMGQAEYDNSVRFRDAAGTTAASAPVPAPSSYQSAEGRAAGDQFEFTLKNRVSIARRRSAMLPLVEAFIRAEKTLVFPGSRAVPGVSMNPAIAAELTNTAGIKLPAGPITVYDGGTYAGDALIEFFPENEKRLISYGDDLSVSGSVSLTNSRMVTAVNISQGVMTITRRQDYERVYTMRNASGEEKKIIIEHPITPGASLSEPVSFDESTPSLYRFGRVLPANGELKFTVREAAPFSERIVLAQLRPETFLSYTTNQEIPANVRSALAGAVELRNKTYEAERAIEDLMSQRTRLISEQDRIRRNLEAAGNQTPQGQEYLRRMVEMDGEIDALNVSLNEAEVKVQAARKEYDDYVAGLNL